MTKNNTYRDSMMEQIKAWDAELEALERESEEIASDAKKERTFHMEELRTRKAGALSAIAAFERAGDERWKRVKARTAAAVTEIRSMLKAAMAGRR